MSARPWICLMYHEVASQASVEGTGGGGPGRFTVSRSSFERMLDAIAARGEMGCSITRALDRRTEPGVAITFDDGTIGQYTEAAPALAARGFTATFFVTTDWVGTSGFMTWEQLRDLARSGMSIQSHTKSHPHLSELDHDRLWAELRDAKARLDDALGQDTTQLALPGGNAPRRPLRHVLGEAGYRVVATSRWGRNAASADGAEPLWIRRCTVPRDLPDPLADRILSGDRRLAAARYTREASLNGIRALLGANRYHRWRRRVLDALG